jgi:hypothetical protein
MKNIPKKIDKEPLTGPLALFGDITHDSLKTKLRRFHFTFDKDLKGYKQEGSLVIVLNSKAS